MNFKCDVYSFGMVLYEMISNCVPFDNLSPIQVAMKVLSEESRPSIPSESNGEIAKLIEGIYIVIIN